MSDIPLTCKGQAFNGPSVYGLLMVYRVPGKTVAPIMFSALFLLDSLELYVCDVKILMQ